MWAAKWDGGQVVEWEVKGVEEAKKRRLRDTEETKKTAKGMKETGKKQELMKVNLKWMISKKDELMKRTNRWNGSNGGKYQRSKVKI